MVKEQYSQKMDDSESDSNHLNTAAYYQQRAYSYSLYKDYGRAFLRFKKILR